MTRALPKRVHGLTLFIVLALACAPAVARADLTWTAPPEACGPGLTPPPQSCGQFLSPAGTTADNLQVATDAAGDAVAVWLQFVSGHTRVAEALRPAGGGFGAATFLSDPTVDAADPCVAMDAAGEAIVCWDQPDPTVSGKQQIFYAMRAPGAAFGPAQNANPSSDGSGGAAVSHHPSAALNARGGATIAYLADDPGTGESWVAAIYKAPDATSFPGGGGAPDVSYSPTDNTVTDTPRVVSNAAGDTLVSFVTTYNPDTDPKSEAEAAFSPAVTDGDPDYRYFKPMETLSASPISAETPFRPSTPTATAWWCSA